MANGLACPSCGGFSLREPGGVRCLVGGHLFLYRRVLPRDHVLSGTDWRGRQRQRALDRGFVSSGRVPEFIFEMLERLEGARSAPPTTAVVVGTNG